MKPMEPRTPESCAGPRGGSFTLNATATTEVPNEKDNKKTP